MENYDVITSDEFTLGRVVRVEDDHLIVEEHHHRHKRQFAIPLVFTGADDAERVVSLTVSKELVENGPGVKGAEFDRQAVAELLRPRRRPHRARPRRSGLERGAGEPAAGPRAVRRASRPYA